MFSANFLVNEDMLTMAFSIITRTHIYFIADMTMTLRFNVAGPAPSFYAMHMLKSTYKYYPIYMVYFHEF